MKCPYCNKKRCDPDYVKNFVRNHGGGIFRFKCKFCNQVIKVGLSRIIRMNFIKKTDEEPDWA